MKRILIILFVIAAAVPNAFTQGNMPTRVADTSEALFSTESLSPSSAFLMLDLMKGNLSDREIKAKYHFVEVNGAIEIPAFVRIDYVDVPKLADFGVRMKHRYGDILTVQIPLDQFVALVQSRLCKLIDVGNVAEPYLNNARAATGVNTVYNNLSWGNRLDGTGVVVGIIDCGFEYGHPAFYDSTGTTLRIKRVWDQNNTSGTPPSAYNYGSELTTETAILAAQHSTDGESESHGTHVAGIAAGCGGPYTDATARTYRGVAPNADIVLVATNLEDASVLHGIEYIKAYAESVNKPCVINISSGHHIGPHDGTSQDILACDNLLQSSHGTLVIRAAGNDGDKNKHISKTLSNDDPTIRTLLDISKIGTIDIWGMPNEHIEVGLFVFNTQTNMYEASSAFYSSANTLCYSESLTDADGEIMTAAINCSSNNSNGRHNIRIEIEDTLQTSEHQRLGIVVRGQSGNTIHIWGHHTTFITNSYLPMTACNMEYTISDQCSGHNIITVGSFVTRTSFTTIDGNVYPSNHPSILNSLSVFSSHGPTLDGRTKPDITAPGEIIYSPINKFDATGINPVVASTTFNNNSEYYGAMEGTSQAAPFVAGILALCLQVDPTMTYSQAIELLRTTATTDSHTGDIGPTGSNRWGWGKVNAVNAIDSLLNNSITIAACGSYEWNGTTYTESGDYTHSYTDARGFIHNDMLHLTINNSVHTATEITASSMYTWNGTDYYFTGDYTYSHPDANGCTQVDTLHLTISNPQNNILEYWFDQQYANRTVTTLGSTTWQTQINVGSLDVGLHSLHMHLRNSEGRCSPPRTALFYKMIEADAAGIPNMDYTFWFDQDFASQQTIPYVQGGSLIDVSQLSDGLHTLNVIIGSGMATDLHSHIFYKMPYVGASGFNYTCWFDQNYGNHWSGPITGGAMLFEVGNINVGLHTFNMQIGSGASAQLQSHFFYCAPRAAALADTATLFYSYSIDDQLRPTLSVSPQNRLIHLDLDVTNTSAGLHSLYGWLSTADGTAMSQHSAWFYAQPEGGIGISRYEYWFNDDYDNRTEVAVTPFVDSLRVITLLQVDTMPINSNNFQFVPNGGAPVIYSRNSISFRFWNSVMRWSSVTRQYVDQRVAETVIADTIERNTTKTIATPGTGQIHWFKLAAGPGDSLSFRTNRRGTMQLYAPSGAMVLHASADSVLTWNSCRVWENGVYYLAVHDVEGGGNTDVSYLYYINQSCLSTATVAACESYTWNGNTYTESGTYIYRTIGDGGCDSVAILYLTVNTPVHTATTEVACDSYTWNGSTYTTDGSYTYSHSDANGCTQVDTLHLTINHSTAVTLHDTADGSYTWHGTTYTTSGTYQWHGTNASGCDSTETLLLVIIPVGIDTPDGDENIVEIYPNPTTGLLTINANGVALVEVIDNAGRLVATCDNTDRIDLGGLHAGSYMLKIHLPGRTSVLRVILE